MLIPVPEELSLQRAPKSLFGPPPPRCLQASSPRRPPRPRPRPRPQPQPQPQPQPRPWPQPPAHHTVLFPPSQQRKNHTDGVESERYRRVCKSICCRVAGVSVCFIIIYLHWPHHSFPTLSWRLCQCLENQGEWGFLYITVVSRFLLFTVLKMVLCQ